MSIFYEEFLFLCIFIAVLFVNSSQSLVIFSIIYIDKPG